MKYFRTCGKLFILLGVAVILAVPRISFSASSENYSITESSFSEGGGRMESADYAITSTHGHSIGGADMQSGDFTLASGFIASALPSVRASIVIDPKTLNRRSQGKWITCFITLPEGYPKDVFDPYNVAVTRVNKVVLDNIIYSDPEAVPPKRERNNESGNYPDEEEQPDDCENNEEILKVKFPRAGVEAVVPVGEEVELTVTGKLLTAAAFEGHKCIRVIDPGNGKGTVEHEGSPQNNSKKGE